MKLRKDILIQGGFKCDNPACDYNEAKVPDVDTLEEYLVYLESYLDKDCPKCGAPLLTIENYSASVAFMKFIHNPIVAFLMTKLPGKKQKLSVNTTPYGKVHITKDIAQ